MPTKHLKHSRSYLYERLQSFSIIHCLIDLLLSHPVGVRVVIYTADDAY